MRNVFVATSLADARLVHDLLAVNGIESQTVEKLRGNIGTPYSEVWVIDDSDGERALALIKVLHSESDQGPQWRCPACGEPNAPAFELCWQCGKDRGTDPA
jgi:hypothetical protein